MKRTITIGLLALVIGMTAMTAHAERTWNGRMQDDYASGNPCPMEQGKPCPLMKDEEMPCPMMKGKPCPMMRDMGEKPCPMMGK